MKQFFKMMFASMIGFILTIMVLFFIFMGIIASIVSLGKKQTVSLEKNSVLQIKFDQADNRTFNK